MTLVNAKPELKPTKSVDDGPIVFFDGVCGLCNHFVDFVMRYDSAGRIRFAPLQGETAARCADASDIRDLKSLVVVQNDETFRRTAAVVRVLWTLNGVWRVAGTLLWLIPAPLRDLLYNGVARIRYRVFGKRETCRMPTPEERSRVLP